MDTNFILDIGVRIICWFQQASPALDIPFKFFTWLGNLPFFLLLLPFIYWCVDRDTGIKLTVLFLVTAYINGITKNLIALPRPFLYSDLVKQLVDATGYSYPSGHTQTAAVIWGYLFYKIRSQWFRVLAIVLIILIPLSRVYLGVHFPSDLIGGYINGFLLLLFFIWQESNLTRWIQSQTYRMQLFLAIAFPIAFLIIFPTVEKYSVITVATLLGMNLGFSIQHRTIQFSATGTWINKLLRYSLGIVILFLFYIGLKRIFTGFQPLLLFDFIRYALISLWGAFGAPWLFVRLKLVVKQNQMAHIFP